MRYLDLYWIVPKIPKITAMMCKKFARMGAHWYPRKSKICLSSAATCNRAGEGSSRQGRAPALKARSSWKFLGIPWIMSCDRLECPCEASAGGRGVARDIRS